MQNTVFLDFETRSVVDLRSCGTWAYAESPSTDILCMVWARGDAVPKLFVPDTFAKSLMHPVVSLADMQEEFKKLIADENSIFVAHNAFFEKAIWQNVMVKKYGAPSIPAERFRCSAAVAASFSLPRALSNAGIVLGLDKQKDDEGHKVMMALSKPRKETKHNKDEFVGQSYAAHQYEKLYSYCIQDVETERELWKTLRPLSGTELKVWLLDQKINMRGVNVDFDLAQSADELSDLEDEYLNDRLYEVTNGEVPRATNVAQLLKWINNLLVTPIEDTTAGTLRGLLLHDDLQPELREAIEIRQAVGKTSVKKYARILSSLCSDGRLRDLLMYHGASTGRWTGKLVQMQNLPRGTFKSVEEQEEAIKLIKTKDLNLIRQKYKNVKDVLSNCIRGIIIPSKGHELFVADYASIEARVLFWLANHQHGVDMYEAGQDLYVDMAARIYNKQQEDVTKGERALGKQAILGCGYGMGAKKFKETCANYDIDIDLDMAETVKDLYRSVHSPVVSFWYAVERAAIEACETGEPVKCGKVVWAKVGKFLHCKLPSGRLLSYYKPRVKPIITPWGSDSKKLYFYGENSVSRKFVEEGTYGGRLVENITQAVARDLMAEAMLKCEDAGYKILLSVHDELIAEAPLRETVLAEDGQYEIKLRGVPGFIRLLEDKPEWAKGCPITAEGWNGMRYKK